jgi:hypothetical protein
MDQHQWYSGADAMSVLQIVHCLFDVLVTFVLMGLAWETTNDHSFFGTPQQKWAAMRRLAYAMMGLGFFARAMMIAEPRMNLQVTDLLSAAFIALPILFFLAVRALGLVSQDSWVGLNGYRNRHAQERHHLFDW